MAKNKILQLINQAIGAELVNEVIFFKKSPCVRSITQGLFLYGCC
jgi:hypothetical protein